jgi:hypothetical protein
MNSDCVPVDAQTKTPMAEARAFILFAVDDKFPVLARA